MSDTIQGVSTNPVLLLWPVAYSIGYSNSDLEVEEQTSGNCFDRNRSGRHVVSTTSPTTAEVIAMITHKINCCCTKQSWLVVIVLPGNHHRSRRANLYILLSGRLCMFLCQWI